MQYHPPHTCLQQLCSGGLQPRNILYSKLAANQSKYQVAELSTLTGELLVATGRSLIPLPGGEALIPAAQPSDRPPPTRDCLVLPPFRGRCLIPSSRRTSKIFAGRSSTSQPTRMRHSGHLSSFLELTMFSKQRRQKVCWQGRTLAVVSSRSKHTEHSNRSNRDDSSISHCVINDVNRVGVGFLLRV